jgi:hypothetical protein
VSEIPKQFYEIAERLRKNEKLKRRSIESILKWFDAERRGAAVVANIREALASVGLEIDPDFTEGGVKDVVSFRLVEGPGAPVLPNNIGAGKNVGAKASVGTVAELPINKVIAVSEETSDDILEPEADDDPKVEVDDKPVISKPADWNISTLRDKWERGFLDLQPHFQREYVWKLKPELPSRLIESVLLEIPIPPLYFGRLNSGKLEVIDGQQRLTSLMEFVTNKFRLQRLTRMPSLNDLFFRELSVENQEKILDTPIRTVEINAGNNTELRYEIFERLNRGSMALNEQELRNCVFRGPFNVLLSELELDKKWRNVKGGEAPEPRFKEREMILRFFALSNRVEFYKGGLKRFLNEYMANYAPSDPASLEEQARMFRQAMQNIYAVFGANSGRLYNVPSGGHDGRWDKKFSIAAFEIQASALIGQDTAKVQKASDQIREEFLLLLLANKEIQSAISQATGGYVATKLRWTLFKSAVQRILTGISKEPRFFRYETRKDMFEKSPMCQLCKNEIHSFEDCAVDHITPFVKGGRTIVENAQLSHRSCNAIKNASLPEATLIP